MRVPLSWLREFVPDLTAPADEVATALIRAGLEVEQVHALGADVRGVVVGRVVEVEELTEFLPKKAVRFCRVDVGTKVHDVVCGAQNFVVGDLVPFALPGASLPGGFEIASRKTYGRLSDGMICSEAELGLAEASDGILVLADGELGTDVVGLLGLREDVLDIAITPDRGYTLSIRGVAREAATAFGLTFRDKGLAEVPGATADGYPVVLDDPGCDRFVARALTGFDPAAPSPEPIRRRLAQCGMRPISLAVDVTNYVMLELGQPTHAYDLATLSGPIVVRRPAHHGRLGAHRACGRHGGARDGDHRLHHLDPGRGGALRAVEHHPRRAPAPAPQRGEQAVRAGRRPRPRTRRGRPHRPAAGRARWGDTRRRHGRARAERPRGDPPPGGQARSRRRS
jgi:phenylalanyl-tRNA synthetase beta chain